ncbi:MAG: phage antirepressor KilAC domain-containing protein [Oscillospiraceae bacterium]|nr:phage antirepressor KilAC domain-containing protein [Oscillospiraceae bacterium]
MNELIKVNYDNADRPTVSGRELHEALGVNEKYTDWFKRMCEYGFTDWTDFILVSEKTETNNPKNPYTTRTNHQITIPMAKELCMLQRTEKGKQMRQYFIAVEEQWNSPDAIMARALQLSNAKLKQLETHCCQLETTVAVQEQQIAELQPKASYYDVVLNCKDLLSITSIAKDYGKSGTWLNNYLHEKGVQYKQGKIWLLYQKYAEKGYTSTKTQTFPGNDGQQHTNIHTYWTQKGRLFIYSLLKADGIFPLIEQEEKTATDVA